MPLSDKYIVWNRALAEHCFMDKPSRQVYLTVTPRILASAISRFDPRPLTPDEATEDFVLTVSEAYLNQVPKVGLGIAFSRFEGSNRLPTSIAFLALSVLAAYQMRADEDVGANAYYRRLAGLLRCRCEGNYPQGFNPEDFERLWVALSKTLSRIVEKSEQQLAMPGINSGARRYISFPLTHVPLRQIDVEKLPEFFAWAGYEPKAKISYPRINADLDRWGKLPYTFSIPGREALNDDRREAAIAEIAQELEVWDGLINEPNGRRSAVIEFLLDFPRRQPQLFYLPRRPPIFPESFDAGIFHFHAGAEGWYSPVPIQNTDSQLLIKDIQLSMQSEHQHFILRRSHSKAISLVSSQDYAYSGYMSRHSLIPGVSCAALVHQELLDVAIEYLATVSATKPTLLKEHPRLPDGWCLFHNFRVEHYLESIPNELSGLAIEQTADFIFTGGLRVGRKQMWIVGAPPRISVSCSNASTKLMLDGQVVSVSESGELIDEDCKLHIPGIHTLTLGDLSKRIEIIEPRISSQLTTWDIPTNPVKWQFALPPGTWQLVGAVPGQVTEVESNSWNGSLTKCSFSAIWAIKIQQGQPSKALYLDKVPTLPQVSRSIPKRTTGVEKWVSIIHNAGLQGVDFASLHSILDSDQLSKLWSGYSFKAGSIKLKWEWKN